MCGRVNPVRRGRESDGTRVRLTCVNTLEEPLKELLAAQLKVLSNVAENRGKGADAKGTVSGNGDVMLATFQGGKAEMAASLAGDSVPEHTQRSGEFLPREIPGKPHAVITSSRTKWRRISLGACPSSKWHRTASRT